MCDTKKTMASISIRPTHGTARLIHLSYAVPQEKSDKERFWVKALVDSLPSISKDVIEIISTDDDSHGKPDVIVKMRDETIIGIQVTELTSELRREREAIRSSYLSKVLALLKEEGICCKQKILIKLLFSDPESKLKTPSLNHVIRAIQQVNIDDIQKAQVGDRPVIIEIENCRLFFDRVDESDFYVPHVNNIGVDVDFDLIPRTLYGYQQAVYKLHQKKLNSKSPWLLIWSVDFLRDKHWLGDQLIDYMKTVFQETSFSHVYFAESENSVMGFDANLNIHNIKEPTSQQKNPPDKK